MSEAPTVKSSAATPPRPAASLHQPQALAARAGALEPLRRCAARATNEWLPFVTWSMGRTGRPGLVGAALVAASAVFFLSTQLNTANEVARLRSDLATARAREAAPSHDPAERAGDSIRELPGRAEMPALLGSLLVQADAARLTIDTGKYEMSSTKAGDIVRYKVSFPVAGPYPQVRQFLDSILQAMPSAAISDLSIERKTIGDGAVEAQIRLTIFTRGTP